MPDMTRERAGELVRRLFQILEVKPEGMRARTALKLLAESVKMSPSEAGEYRPGVRRFEKRVRFATIPAVKARWLIKDQGTWTLTDRGKEALHTFEDPLEFMNESVRLYREWRSQQRERTPGSEVRSRSATEPTIPPQEEWFWEGNVQTALARFLAQEGWSIDVQSDTAAYGRGPDIVASTQGRLLAIEVKGFPGTTYARGPRAGQPKPTQPTLQARHWYANALLSALLMRNKMPQAEVALGFPHFPRYERLIEATEESLSKLGIGVFLVSEGGGVFVRLSARPPE